MKIESIKKLIFTTVFSCILILNLGSLVFAERNNDIVLDGIRYSINNNEAELSEILNGTVVPNNFIIPSEIKDSDGNEYIVTSISEFVNINTYDNITSVTISKSITRLYATTFINPFLKTIEVDADNTMFASENGVLYNNDKTQIFRFPCANEEAEFEIPDEVKIIGANAFAGCQNLSSIIISDSVKTIYRRAFADCRGITSMNIPDSVEYIDAGVFQGCTNLQSVQISDNIDSINTDNLFGECSSLSSFVFPKNVSSIGWGMFTDCSSLKSVKFNEQMDFLGDKAFKNCTSLSEIVIPAGIKEIGLQCFEGCTSLKSITIPKSVEIYSEDCFKKVSSDCIFKIPFGADIEAYAKRLHINENQIKTYQINDNNIISESDSIIASDSIRGTNSEVEINPSIKYRYVIIIIILTILIVIGGGVMIKKRS